MKKVIATSLFALLISSNCFAFDKLSPKDQDRIWGEATSMQEFLDLSDSETREIAQLKADLNRANNALIKKYGQGSPDHQAGRAPYWKAYRTGLLEIVPQKDLNRYNKSLK